MRLNPFTLSFRDAGTELAFRRHELPRLRLQGRMAIGIGVFIYLLYSALDTWLVPADQQATIWTIRLTALCVPAAVFALTYHPLFERFNHLPLALVGLAAGAGLIGMIWHLPLDAVAYYYPGLILATFYTYNFIGTRFIHALTVDIALVVAYNLIFGGLRDFPPHILASHDFFIISANLIGGTAGYLAEYQRRQLFIHRVELEQEREHHLNRSLHDRLTGLPNRELLDDRIEQLLAQARRDSGCHAGFFIDLDGFKAINDNHGHDIGDLVLREVASRLRSTTRDADTVCRVGGDEFFVLAHEIESAEAAANLAGKLLSRLEEAIPGIPDDHRLSASIGICLFPYDGADAAGIVHQADKAMYQAKAAGKRRFVFSAVPS